MRTSRRIVFGLMAIAFLGAILTALAADQPQHQHDKGKSTKEPEPRRAVEELPKIPQPDAQAAQVPAGYRVEVVLANLTYPTSVEFDDAGTMYIAEGGSIYGDDVAPARILRVRPKGEPETVAEHLNGPITDLLWHDKRLYISHRGKISVLEAGKVRDLVTGLPSLGDHSNNQLTVGPDGKIYFGQGSATNSGVVGLDSFKRGWLAKYPEVHDVPAKDIRLNSQAFETPNILTLLADKKDNGDQMKDMKGMKDMKPAGDGAKAKDEMKDMKHAGDGAKAKDEMKDMKHAGDGVKAKDEMKDMDHGAKEMKGKDEGRRAWFSPLELHPMLNHFPIAFLLGFVALDLFAWWRRRLDLAQIATGLLIAGLLMGVLTAAAGLLAFFTVQAHTEEAHVLMYWHLSVQSVALVLFGLAALLRWETWALPPTFGARLTGFIGALTLTVGSALGGYIVFHGGAGIEPELLALNVRKSHVHGAGPGDQPEEKAGGHKHEGKASKEKEQMKDMKPEGDGTNDKKPMKDMDHAGGGMKDNKTMKGMDHGAEGTKSMEQQMVNTFAFRPFGKTPSDAGTVRGVVKANGTILRMNPDGSNLEVYAWGLRNPFGVMWGPDGKLYAADNGYDERGSRPIANAPDCLWEIKKDAWYGFPDYAGGIPVTDARFQPEQGPAPRLLMRDVPEAEKPLLTLGPNAGVAKIDFSRNPTFGFKGQLFLALAGDMKPITGRSEERSGFEVVRIDPETRKVETFFKAKKSALGSKGLEYVTTAGPRRPVGVRFSPDGKALYVVDVGALAIINTAIGPTPRPFPRTGVVWRITRTESAAN